MGFSANQAVCKRKPSYRTNSAISSNAVSGSYHSETRRDADTTSQSTVGCFQTLKCVPLAQIHKGTGVIRSIESARPALLRDFRQSFVRTDRRVLKLPRLLTGWWRSPPLKLPGESSRKRSGDDAQGLLGEFGILLGGLRESKAAQFRVDLNRLHAIIIPLRVGVPSAGPSLRHVSRGQTAEAYNSHSAGGGHRLDCRLSYKNGNPTRE